jgi:hypothetical protein
MNPSPVEQRSESSASSDDPDYDTDMTELSLQDINDDNDDDIEATGEKCCPTRPPEYYLANEEAIDSSGVVQKEYSEATRLALDTIEQQWVQYVSTRCANKTV